MSGGEVITSFCERLLAMTSSLTLLVEVLLHRHVRRRPVVVVRRGFNLGDVICTWPAVRMLRGKYPGCLLIYETAAPFVDVVKAAGVADIVLSNSRPLKRLTDQFAIRADHCFTPHYSDETGDGDGLHIVHEFARALSVVISDPQPRLPVAAAWRTSMVQAVLSHDRSRTGPLIVVHSGPTWGVRTWPGERWNTLCRRLIAELDARIIQLGTTTLVPGTGMVDIRIDGAFDCVGTLALGESIAVVASADLFIGIDSGLLHIAGAVGTTSLCIFGPTRAAYRLPLATPSRGVTAAVPCAGCHHTRPIGHTIATCPHNVKCMRSIEAETVFEAVTQLINHPVPESETDEKRSHLHH